MISAVLYLPEFGSGFSGEPTAQNQPLYIAFRLKGQDKEIGREEEHAAEKGKDREAEASGQESIAPSGPQCGEREEAHKIKIKLPGPGHVFHIAEEYRQKIYAVVRNRHTRISD